MSIYDKASLVLIPSGTKTSKVYSQKPVNGDGDFTFSRSTAATRVNADGDIEKETQNLLTYSNTFSSWTFSSASVTSGHSGYDGTTDAWELTKSAASGRTQQTISTSGVQTYSVYAKAGTYDWALLLITTTSGDRIAYFDLANGVVGTGFSLIDSRIESVGGGWYRCTIVFDASTTTARVYPALGDTNLGTSGSIYIQDAQLEQGLVARDYIETTTAAVEGGITDNVPRLDYTDASCPSLLLEPSRTNLVVNSEYYNTSDWNIGNATATNNAATSPEGVDNAIKLAEATTTNSFHYIGEQTSGVTTAGTYSISGFVKKGSRRYGGLRGVTNGFVNRYFVLVDLEDGSLATTNTFGSGVTWSHDIKDYGNGWYRIEIMGGHTSGTIDASFSLSDVATPSFSGGLPVFNGTAGEHIFCYGVQKEFGSYATSYIPTYGSAVTRNLENCEVADAALIGQTEGTLFWEGQDIGDTDAPYISLYNNSNNRILLYYSGGNVSAQVRVASVVEFQGGTQSVSGRAKMAVAYKNGSYAFYVNGVAVTTSTNSFSGFVSLQLNKVNLGYFSQDGGRNNQLMVFKTRLSNEELADLTTL